MANVQKFFMAPEDEVAFFRFLERFVLEVYPRRVPPGWEAFRASEENHSRLPEEDLYLVLWAELDVTPQTGRRDAAPDRFRRLFRELDDHMKKTYRKGDPKDFLVGPKAARLFKEGLVLRDSEHRGGTVVPFK
jgi:hypothetical protein